MKRLFLAVPLAALAVGAFAGSASAATYPMTANPVTPANGATIPTQASWDLAFEFQGAVRGASTARVDVSRTPTLGQDGTLADDLLLGVGSVIRRDSDPSRYAGTAKIAYLNTPGTYYYQYKEFVSDYYGAPARNCPDSGPYGGSCTFASPVYAFTVAAPQPVARPAPVSQPIQANVPRALSVASARRAALKRARTTGTRGRPRLTGCAARTATGFFAASRGGPRRARSARTGCRS